MSQTKRATRRIVCAALACLMLAGLLCLPALAAGDLPAETTPASTASDSGESGIADGATAGDETSAPTGDATDDAAGGTGDTTGTTVDDSEKLTLTTEQLTSLANIIAAAVADKNASDTRTPRDRFTAAYLAGDLAAAQDAVRQANEAASKKTKLDLDYSKLNMADVTALIEKMRTEVSLEPSSGLMETIKQAAGSILNWMTSIVGGNYVLGMCVFALLIELLMLPLAIKQQKNSIKQASLQPKEKAIRKKYAGRDDKATQQKVATEIQEMYQKEGFNPASGCMPLLIQFPIIIILYNVVINPIVYVMKLSSQLSTALYTFVNTSEAAGGLGQIVNSSRGTIEIASLIRENGEVFFDKLSNFVYYSNGGQMVEALKGAHWPDFNLFGLNTGLVPSITEPSWLLIIPILTFAVYFASMKLSRKLTYQPTTTDQSTGCSNTVMDVSMPIMSTVICFMVPGALGIYWMVKSIFSTLVRFILSKAMPLPKFTEEDYKAAEREIIKGKPVAGPRVSSSGKVIRSLHHIDDEDFDDTREAAIARRERIEAQERREAEEQQKRVENSAIKTDEDRPQLSFKELRQKLKETRRQKADEKKQAGQSGKAESGNVEDTKAEGGKSEGGKSEGGEAESGKAQNAGDDNNGQSGNNAK